MLNLRKAALAAVMAALSPLLSPMTVADAGPGQREFTGAGATKAEGKELILPEPMKPGARQAGDHRGRERQRRGYPDPVSKLAGRSWEPSQGGRRISFELLGSAKVSRRPAANSLTFCRCSARDAASC
jgi:hypothetical protein